MDGWQWFYISTVFLDNLCIPPSGHRYITPLSSYVCFSAGIQNRFFAPNFKLGGELHAAVRDANILRRNSTNYIELFAKR